MKKIRLFLLLVTTIIFGAKAQVKIGNNPTTINAGSVLELESTNKGLLLTRVSLTSTTIWGLAGVAANGMMVYNTNASITQGNSAYPTIKGGKGMYYWDGTGWVSMKFEAGSTFQYGAGAPSGACSGDVIYVDTSETSLTSGQTWTCSGGTWLAYTPKSGTEWMFSGGTNDAGGDKISKIWRKGYIGISPTFSPFKPGAPLHILNDGQPGKNQDNIVIESYGSTGMSPRYYGITGTGSYTTPGYLIDNQELVALAGRPIIPAPIGQPQAILSLTTDGVHSATSSPTKFRFFTTDIGSNTAYIRATLKNNGYFGLGTETPTSGFTIFGENGTNYLDPNSGNDIRMIGYAGTGSSIKASLIFESNRGASLGSTVTTRLLQGGDGMGSIFWGNKDDISSVQIDANVPQNWSATSHPGELVLLTTPIGTITALQRMIIKENGFVGINQSLPETMLHVNYAGDCTSRGTVGNNGVIYVGPTDGTRLMIDNNEIMALTNNTAGGSLLINGPPQNNADGSSTFSGGNVLIGYNQPLNEYAMSIESTNNRVVVSGNMKINQDVAIGGGAPGTHAKLDVTNWEYTNIAAGKYFGSASTALQNWGGGSQFLSIWATHAITAPSFFAYSDIRIKKDIGTVSGTQSLDFINKLNIVDYKYKDEIGNGSNMQKGTIAQEVEKIAPNAITTLTDFIPSIYAVSTNVVEDKNNKTLTVSLKNETDLKVGDKVRIISNSSRNDYEVVEIINSNTFKINNWNEQLMDNSVFVYGKEVNDYKSVNYDYLYTANIAATQELYKMILDLQNENASLKTEMNKMGKLQGQIDLIKAELDNLNKNSKITER
jgi:hypothetical protein